MYDEIGDYESFVVEHYGDTAEGISETGKAGASFYISQGPALNTILRTGDLTEGMKKAGVKMESANKQLAKMDDLFKSTIAEIPKDVTVYRGMSLKGVDWEKSIGKTFSDKGFVSTSTSKKIAGAFAKVAFDSKENAAIVKLRVPKGTKAIPMRAIFGKDTIQSTRVDREREILINRGSSFKITSIRKDSSTNMFEVEAEVVS